MVTGVNAGGKTMLLKSLLSIAYLSKMLIPMKIDNHHSRVGRFKGIEAVIDDPQNVNFDISTFAGRIVSFSEILHKDRYLIGVDEVELGTDSDEASALFKVLIEKIISKGSKIVITTHHKRLASLMGTDPNVELVAALYDEEKREPTYRFLQGIVGKSYAFETAERYGIPKSFVDEARSVYGDDREKLNELIEKSANLEQELMEKSEKLSQKIAEVEAEQLRLREARDSFYRGVEEKRDELQNIYSGAITEAKSSIWAKTVPDTHRHMTEAHKKLPKQRVEEDKRDYKFQTGDRVKYKSSEGVILQIKGKKARVEVNGMRVELKLADLLPALKIPKQTQSVKVKVEKPDKASLRLDLHGKRREEALEELDIFLSNALLQGWDEVFITHGIGGGVLAKAVNQFLREYPRVEWFGDAPPNMGGQGAKIVKL
jgi:DNA mismatch repair protein MutS2